MKLLIFASLIIFLDVRPAAAATNTDIAAIQEQIFIANRMDKTIGIAEALLNQAVHDNLYPETIRDFRLQLEREKDKQSAARTKAIHMTILAYGLEPANLNGTSVVRETKGRTISWLPIARGLEARQVQSADGNLRGHPQPRSDLSGKVYPDGVTYIYPHAFENGVGYLASTLLHERIHFEQITTEGKGNMMSRAESEAEAYQAEKDHQSAFFNPDLVSDEREMEAVARALAAEKAQAVQDQKYRASVLGGLRNFLPSSNPSDMFESKVHTNAELADITGIVAQARAQAKLAHRDHDDRLRNTVIELTKASCDNPGSVTQEQLNELPQPYNEHYWMLAAPERCFPAYAYLGRRGGKDAQELKSLSTSPVLAQTVQSALRLAQPIQSAPWLAHAIPNRHFSDLLPILKGLAMTACTSPNSVSIDPVLTRYPTFVIFSNELDDRIADNLAAGIGPCESRMFRRLIEVVRSRQGSRISTEWVRTTAEGYRPAPVVWPRYIPPPPQNQDGRCEDYGNVRCP